MTIPFQRLAAAEDAGVREALQGVLASGSFALGPEVERFESAFARTLGVAHGVGVASGTDAITLALRALGIGPGDRVLTTAFSTGYTALGILRAGARPVFGDVERGSLCLAAASVERALEGGGIAAILPVHLFGAAAAGWKDLVEVAARHGVPILEDACQAHGAHFRGQPLGSFGAASAFSFYPTKNLGALGDAGLVATPEAGLAARLRRLRSGGQTRRHHHAAAGWNSRLDELQAAVLSRRLPGLPAANRIRRRLARRYREALLGLPLGFATPGPEVESAWHLFVVRTAERDALRRHLASAGVETLVHYPVTLPRQAAFSQFVEDGETFPEAERAAAEVLSLPLHQRLADSEAERVADAVRSFFGGRRSPPVSE